MTSDATPTIAPARWQAVAFVCTRCGERKGAPMNARKLGQRLREGFRDAKLRSRVVHTGCMGLCPKGAMVAAIGVNGGPLQVAEIRKKREAAAVVAKLTQTDNTESPMTPGAPQ